MLLVSLKNQYFFRYRGITYNVVGDARPAEGWPEGTLGVQGKITPIESGYYQPLLQKTDGEWKIVKHRILMDMPMVIPGA